MGNIILAPNVTRKILKSGIQRIFAKNNFFYADLTDKRSISREDVLDSIGSKQITDNISYFFSLDLQGFQTGCLSDANISDKSFFPDTFSNIEAFAFKNSQFSNKKFTVNNYCTIAEDAFLSSNLSMLVFPEMTYHEIASSYTGFPFGLSPSCIYGSIVEYSSIPQVSSQTVDSNLIKSLADEIKYRYDEISSIRIESSCIDISESAFLGFNSLMSVYFAGRSIWQLSNMLNYPWNCSPSIFYAEKNEKQKLYLKRYVTKHIKLDNPFQIWYYQGVEPPVIGDTTLMFGTHEDPYTGRITQDIVDTEIPNHYYETPEGELCILTKNDSFDVVFGSNVSVIGSYAFKDCIKMNKVTGLSCISRFGVGSFQNCYSLSSLSLKDNIDVTESLFEGCSSLTSIENLDRVKSIGAKSLVNSLNDMTSFKSDTITSLGANALSGKTQLTSLVLSNCTTLDPDALNAIGEKDTSGKYNYNISFMMQV